MSDAKIEEMLSKLIEEVDYDIWKEYFLEEYDDGDRVTERQRLIEICKEFIDAG